VRCLIQTFNVIYCKPLEASTRYQHTSHVQRLRGYDEWCRCIILGGREDSPVEGADMLAVFNALSNQYVLSDAFPATSCALAQSRQGWLANSRASSVAVVVRCVWRARKLTQLHPHPRPTALSLITSRFVNGNTVRNFPTHGQLSAAQGNLISCLNFDFAF
jgi:hypothetical protein